MEVDPDKRADADKILSGPYFNQSQVTYVQGIPFSNVTQYVQSTPQQIVTTKIIQGQPYVIQESKVTYVHEGGKHSSFFNA